MTRFEATCEHMSGIHDFAWLQDRTVKQLKRVQEHGTNPMQKRWSGPNIVGYINEKGLLSPWVRAHDNART